jgi:hypothetical protein
MVPAAAPETESGEIFVVALPRIVVDFDADGVPSMMGFGLDDLAQYGLYVPNVAIPKMYINEMVARNIQHVELRQTGNGIVLIVNGKPMPHIGWSDQGLQATANLASLFGMGNTGMIGKFLPIVRRLGLDLVLRFPVAEGQAPVELINPDVAVNVAAAPSDTPASAVVAFEVKYDENGVPGILGITAADLAAMGINAPLALSPEYIALLQANNIQSMELRTKNDGIFIYVNGIALPNIVWDDAMLANAAETWVMANPGVQQQYVDIARSVAPMLNKADIAIMVHFPLAAGAEPIAAKMHF